MGGLNGTHPLEPLAGHRQQDAGIFGSSSKISLGMGCRSREGRGAGLRDRSGSGVERRKRNAGRQRWEAGRVGGDSRHLLRRFPARSLGCGLLNVYARSM